MMQQKGIYVEIVIDGSLDTLWERTQDPALHRRWDLRFTDIEYLPRAEGEPQRFLYATRIGFGLAINGEGESTGTRDGVAGERTSALRFWSDSRMSLIRAGAGYWKYIPVDGGVRFLTWYDYRTRFGSAGRLVDILLFRPLMGWATAWSFDRLRLWIERGIDPALSLERSLVHFAARATVVAIFLYHGIVPKLLGPHPDEIAMFTASGFSHAESLPLVVSIGIAEIIIAILLAVLRNPRPLLLLIAVAMAASLAAIAMSAPRFLLAPFNPVSLNLAVVALCAVASMTAADRPSAARCLRTRPPGNGASGNPL